MEELQVPRIRVDVWMEDLVVVAAEIGTIGQVQVVVAVTLVVLVVTTMEWVVVVRHTITEHHKVILRDLIPHMVAL
jgi:hypothetical protein